MKKILFVLCAAAMAIVSCYDDSQIWETLDDHESRIEKLERICTQMNSDISNLKTLVSALSEGDCVVSANPLATGDGYTLTFKSGKSVVIYHGKDGADGKDGLDGITPVIGVKQDADGKYYWTLNGQWLLDDAGSKIPAAGKDGKDGVDGKDGIDGEDGKDGIDGTDGTDGKNGVDGKNGITPKLKIEEGFWYVSYDNGTEWIKLDRAIYADYVPSIFADVEVTGNDVVLLLADGTTITVPLSKALDIVFGEFAADRLQVGVDVIIPYTIEGDVAESSIFLMTDKNDMFEAELQEETPLTGNILIRQLTDTYHEISGKVAVFVTDEEGHSILKLINIASGVLYPTDREDSFYLKPEASQVELIFATNREMKVDVNADWISLVQTKAVEEKTLVFDIAENTGTRRKAMISVSSGYKRFDVEVIQGGNNDFKINVDLQQFNSSEYVVGLYDYTNSAGHTLADVLGYDSWEDLAADMGDWDTQSNLQGNLVMMPYDLETGKTYGTRYNYNLGYMFDETGALVPDYSDLSRCYWTRWSDMDPFFRIGVRPEYVTVGDKFSFGMMFLRRDTGVEAVFEVNIAVSEYEDPQAGLYDDPAEPGEYHFPVNATYDVVRQTLDTDMNEAAEFVRKTFGLTDFEIFKGWRNGEFEGGFITASGESDWQNIELDVNGSMWGDDEKVVNAYWSSGFDVFQCNIWCNESIVNHVGETVRFAYKFVKTDPMSGEQTTAIIDVEITAEETDPEAGLYDTPAEPGEYHYEWNTEINVADGSYQYNFEVTPDVSAFVKNTLGMTSYQMYKEYLGGILTRSFILSDGEEKTTEYILLDVNGKYTEDWGEGLVNVSCSIGSMGFNWHGWLESYKLSGDQEPLSYSCRFEKDGIIAIVDHNISFVSKDPEEGKYSDYTPGNHEYEISDVFNVASSTPFTDEWLYRYDVIEYIKKTLGLTSDQIKAGVEDGSVSATLILAGVEYPGNQNVAINKSGAFVPDDSSEEDYILELRWGHLFDGETESYLGVYPIEGDEVNGMWTYWPYTYEAVGTTVSYQFKVVRHAAEGDVEIVIKHSIEFVNDPSACKFGICGTNTDWSGDITMTYDETYKMYFAENVAFMGSGNAFKIRENQTWDYGMGNFGLSRSKDIEADHYLNLTYGGGSENIMVNAGTYDIWFDRTGGKVYVMTPGNTPDMASAQ